MVARASDGRRGTANPLSDIGYCHRPLTEELLQVN
jgi:hypothetical protein